MEAEEWKAKLLQRLTHSVSDRVRRDRDNSPGGREGLYNEVRKFDIPVRGCRFRLLPDYKFPVTVFDHRSVNVDDIPAYIFRNSQRANF